MYAVSVRRTRDLPTTSFRFHLTVNTLAVQLYISHYLGMFGTFHPLECIFRKNRALAPHERSAVPLGTDHCPVG
ncbi:hypothetical protein DXC06_05885 [Ruminococcus sp. OM07-7]|nr:hypothetical protein DXC06_05885 [Ruminococcus sp. OM07-7]